MNTPTLLFLDFETYYAKDYTLRKMTPAEYILDPRYETQCVAVKVDDGPIDVIDGPDFGQWLSKFDPAVTVTVTFNALFDNCILAWHYGFVPFRMIDALGMARAKLGHQLRSLSLASVSQHLGVGEKTHTIQNVVGLRRNDITSRYQLWSEFKEYAANDCDLLYKVFKALLPFPEAEQRIMDLVLRATVQPRLVLNEKTLTDHLAEVQASKARLLEECGADVPDLMSTPKFAALLEAKGVEIDLKTSPTGNIIPALAKTDDFMQRLLEHSDPQVQALAAARLGHKSTLEETRCERMLSIVRLPWSSYRDGNPRLYSGGTMPIPLRYSGAHTHRLSGDWKLNMQNLPRGSRLRYALEAPEGSKLIVADLGQIEARLTAWFCNATVLMAQFREKRDPYNELATEIFRRPIDRRKPSDMVEGFIGKTGILGLGYGAGADKFYSMVVSLSKAQGINLGSSWTEELAKHTVGTYRAMHKEIPRVWQSLDNIMKRQLAGISGSIDGRGAVKISQGQVLGPNNLPMLYDQVMPDGNEWYYGYGGRRHKLYGAKFLENIIQYLARIVLMNAALRLNGRGYRFVLQAHDELGFIVPDAGVEEAKRAIHDEMVRPPSWALDLPLTASVGVGQNYGEAK